MSSTADDDLEPGTLQLFVHGRTVELKNVVGDPIGAVALQAATAILNQVACDPLTLLEVCERSGFAQVLQLATIRWYERDPRAAAGSVELVRVALDHARAARRKAGRKTT